MNNEVGDRLPPQNIEAETEILGGILMDPDAIARVAETLKPEAFYLTAHQEIYRAAMLLASQGRPTDLTSVSAWLDDRELLDKIGGTSTLRQLVEQTPSSINIDQYAKLVLDKYVRRQLIRASNRASGIAYDASIEIPQVLDRIEQEMFEVTQDRVKKALVPASDILLNIFAELEEKSLQKDALPGIPTGFYDLDSKTQGLQRSDLVIVAGRPSMGKTAICLNMAHNIAAQTKLPVAVFSLEMSREQLVQRLLASEAKIESHRLRSGRISEHEWQRLSQSIGNLSELPIFIDDTANATVTEIRSKARRLQAEQGGALGMILLDYLQLMEGSGSDNRVLELARITRGLKALAKELNAPVVVLSQLSRAVESRSDKRPQLSDLRESGSIEQDADLVLMLYRDEYYDPGTLDKGLAEVIIVKHRNGPTGTVKLLFENQYTQFRNLAVNQN
ncbi:MAG: replicative DNA helicase [Synechococcus sp.]